MSKRVIFYLIDGARPDILRKLVDSGELPHIKNLLVDQGSMTKGTTCFPSTTGPAYLPFLTGSFPGDHDITGIRWFDKKHYKETGRWSRNAMRSYCGYEAKYFNDDMNERYPSLFEEYSDGINIYNMITKGVKVENDITQKGKAGLYFKAHFYHRHHEVDQAGHVKLMKSLDRKSPFTFAVFPSIDWDSHTYHYDDAHTTHRAYRLVDDSLGELYEKLHGDGCWEDTLLIMASDHGLSATHTHLDLGNFFTDHKYRVLEYPKIFKIKPNVAIFISGNSFASIAFLDQKNDYRKTQLEDTHGEVLSDLIGQKAIDFVIYRGDDGQQYLVRNNDGCAMISYEKGKLSYRIESADVLALGDEVESLDYNQVHEATFSTEYPDSLWQCHQLMQSPRSGDVVISAATGYDLRDFWEIPEHKGSHGSLHWEHMHIPILTNQKNHITGQQRSADVHQVIKTWLTNG